MFLYISESIGNDIHMHILLTLIDRKTTDNQVVCLRAYVRVGGWLFRHILLLLHILSPATLYAGTHTYILSPKSIYCRWYEFFNPAYIVVGVNTWQSVPHILSPHIVKHLGRQYPERERQIERGRGFVTTHF